MKRPLVLAIMVSLAASLATSASADIDSYWLVVLRASNILGKTNSIVQCGTQQNASDEYRSPSGSIEDAMQPTASGARAYLTTDVRPGYNNVARDCRAPLALGSTKIWNLYTWQVDDKGAKTAGAITISGWIHGIVGADIGSGVTVRLVGPWIDPQPDYTFQNDTLTSEAKGSQTSPLFTRTVAYDGVNDVHLQLIATAAVPEPGSMVTLLCGIASIGGLALRRRK